MATQLPTRESQREPSRIVPEGDDRKTGGMNVARTVRRGTYSRNSEATRQELNGEKNLDGNLIAIKLRKENRRIVAKG